MRARPDKKVTAAGYCLAELMAVLSLLGMCLAIGLVHLTGMVPREQARAAAQSTQAAVAWAQMGALWAGDGCEVSFGSGGLVVSSEASSGGALRSLTPDVAVSANVSRWNTLDGIILGFSSPWATPDSGGSLFFGSGGYAYKVIVRPESGLTVRDWVAR